MVRVQCKNFIQVLSQNQHLILILFPLPVFDIICVGSIICVLFFFFSCPSHDTQRWINDDKKKITTSAALAVSRFHLDGPSHLEERGEKSNTELELVSAAAGATNPKCVWTLPPILIAALWCWSKSLGCKGKQNSVLQLSWLEIVVFLLPVVPTV